jgi:autophagy-related protein 2
VLPIKLHVDQDALDFMKKFFSFENPGTPASIDSHKTELYFRLSHYCSIPFEDANTALVIEHVEVFPVDIKLDYKPKRVDYKALREGKTIELMNFFHFDGADITLRHITLSGVSSRSPYLWQLNPHPGNRSPAGHACSTHSMTSGRQMSKRIS